MENGGNVRAHDYFKKHGAVFGNVIDYKHQAVQKYKQELERKVFSLKNRNIINYQVETIIQANSFKSVPIPSPVNEVEPSKQVEEKAEEKFVCNLTSNVQVQSLTDNSKKPA